MNISASIWKWVHDINELALTWFYAADPLGELIFLHISGGTLAWNVQSKHYYGCSLELLCLCTVVCSLSGIILLVHADSRDWYVIKWLPSQNYELSHGKFCLALDCCRNLTRVSDVEQTEMVLPKPSWRDASFLQWSLKDSTTSAALPEPCNFIELWCIVPMFQLLLRRNHWLPNIEFDGEKSYALMKPRIEERVALWRYSSGNSIHGFLFMSLSRPSFSVTAEQWRRSPFDIVHGTEQFQSATREATVNWLFWSYRSYWAIQSVSLQLSNGK
jgi:hypothetical protein